MLNILTFIIPVRHQDNAKDWNALKQRLSSTVRSIAAQTDGRWKAIIVANHGADLPPLPERFEVEHVDFPPNPLHERGNADEETFYERFRIDKGRRVLAGMLHAGQMGHVMIVDDDDFVSNRLVAFVAEQPRANGWYVKNGYVWGDGGNLLCLHPRFARFCGTCHIVRADLYGLPKTFEDASETYIKRMLGDHHFIDQHLARAGTPLEPLPFPGAVYRIGHAGAHSRSKGLIRHVFFRKVILKRPWKLGLLLRMRRLTPALRREFFGEDQRHLGAVP